MYLSNSLSTLWRFLFIPELFWNWLNVVGYPSMSYICDPASVSISQISPKPHFVGCLNIEKPPSSSLSPFRGSAIVYLFILYFLDCLDIGKPPSSSLHFYSSSYNSYIYNFIGCLNIKKPVSSSLHLSSSCYQIEVDYIKLIDSWQFWYHIIRTIMMRSSSLVCINCCSKERSNAASWQQSLFGFKARPWHLYHTKAWP